MTLTPIAHITTDYPEKFGVPRQAGLAEGSYGYILFEEEYRFEEAVRGLEGFSYIWVIWGFSENKGKSWHPTVRPPRLGGNERVGLFATRSPMRPNPIGLSCLRIVKIRKGPVIVVEGPDMVSGTPIYDIKPYIPYADCHPDAKEGFSSLNSDHLLDVIIPKEIEELLQADDRALRSLLSQDPRPRYHHDPERIYGLSFRSWNITFRVEDEKCIVLSAEKIKR